jgi:DNA-binding PadR family transcriptional regulator
MNVRTLCLAILYFGDATGYEIRKLSTEGKYSYFVEASYGAIYPALAKLEQEGLVTCRDEVSAGKPARKVYSITEDGRRAFVTSLLDLPAPDIFRSEFLLVAMCSDILPKAVVRRAVDERIGQLEAEIDHLKQVSEGSNHPGSKWAANYGVSCLSTSLRYLQDNRRELEEIAGSAIDHDNPVPAE